MAVVRPDDLLALRIETRNLDILPGSPPRLVKTRKGSSHLILHFPPQAITEETFFERAPRGTNNPEDDPATKNPHPADKPKPDGPGGNPDNLRVPPVRARIAGESRLVFRVREGFDIPYTLEGVLQACLELEPRVAANAPPPAPSRLAVVAWPTSSSPKIVKAMTPRQRANLSSFALRSLRIGALQGDSATVRARQFAAGPALKRVITGIGKKPDLSKRRRPPRPAAPGSATTAIELPWRLILSPHSKERWRHALQPVTSPTTQHTELWHSRLVAPDGDGEVIEPPYPDPQRTVRAIWALTGEASTKAMQSQWPDPQDIPDPSIWPFRMPLDDFDRFQFAHLSSNFSVSGYAPDAVDTNLMMLTALGGWLDSRGAWEPPGLSVEEWVHRASMARDHYVRVVYRGFLFPLRAPGLPGEGQRAQVPQRHGDRGAGAGQHRLPAPAAFHCGARA